MRAFGASSSSDQGPRAAQACRLPLVLFGFGRRLGTLSEMQSSGACIAVRCPAWKGEWHRVGVRRAVGVADRRAAGAGGRGLRHQPAHPGPMAQGRRRPRAGSPQPSAAQGNRRQFRRRSASSPDSLLRVCHRGGAAAVLLPRAACRQRGCLRGGAMPFTCRRPAGSPREARGSAQGGPARRRVVPAGGPALPHRPDRHVQFRKGPFRAGVSSCDSEGRPLVGWLVSAALHPKPSRSGGTSASRSPSACGRGRCAGESSAPSLAARWCGPLA